ncbi:hypothetical protein KL86DPRO_20366 [uncultured delta proteobacterium]|uniref:Uncharacterized protein n=1 Tax=uncultured delta proteobacterium TaxID=34034 RepID=A0A212JZR4_9DELT|nr:hypothetical protein KL86DPRO_20366 [uncultured delta proteobacterium]
MRQKRPFRRVFPGSWPGTRNITGLDSTCLSKQKNRHDGGFLVQFDDKPRKAGFCKGTLAPAFNGGNESRLRLRGGPLPKRNMAPP